ncbi:NAD(P)-dependent oxidoreductase [Aliirhizobium terrae]|uniref:NAD-dependent epimerase/dehydratase family protein n=1 Tax=Terrirhizobium terrae TaxID=2926709 RepID=UPI002574E704|nr:NAD(P)-dependent oxidoreductase [Rhizobium sp. CC-CFT758]WJH39050.1 NAD(P)-dependent oxidoreductase [Rhizobium sp. CC-CFT758]
MKRLLITGASGFIGRHCAKLAAERGFDVWATRSGRSNDGGEDAHGAITWRTVDLLAPAGLERLLDEAKPTHVLHTAWVTEHGSYWSSPANLDWLALGARFFKRFAEIGGQRFVCAGTCAEYDWSYGFMVEDTTPDLPGTFYGSAKLIHHQTLMATANQLGFSAASGRIFFAYGPHENSSRFIPSICRSLAQGSEAAMGSGRFFRDFMHVEDVASGFLALLESGITGSCNISSGEPRRLIDIAMTLGRFEGKEALIRAGARQDKVNEPDMLVGSNRKLLTTGWQPKIEFEEGLLRTYEWWKNVSTKDQAF